MTTNCTTTSGAADLREAAQAVVDRWDTPLWKDVPATAEYIGRLRAALAAGQAVAAQPGLTDAYVGAREDLSIWKRRALEAEATVRNFVREANSPTFMGEAARLSAQPVAEQVAAYAALPEYGINTASHAHFRVLGFTADQMRAFADATHTLRAPHGQAPAQADSVQEDAALWHWLAEYLVGTRTDLDDELVACETVDDMRKLVKAAIKQGATK